MIRSVWDSPSSNDAVLAQLTALRDQLKICLSNRHPEPGTEPQVDGSALAEQIKTFKAAHSVEAAPERMCQRRATTEEPVTSRIHGQMAVEFTEGSKRKKYFGVSDRSTSLYPESTR
jgi:hypothetical protein